MPWEVKAGSTDCPPDKPFAVVKKATGETVGCHASKEAAQQQLAALYASEQNMSDVGHVTYLVDLATIELTEANGTDSCWVHALPIGSYTHPMYGKLNVDNDRVQRFADGVKNKVRGVEPSINYVHNNQDVAAGWVKDAEARNNGLWLFIEWVKDAAQAIRDKKWKYFSSEIADSWKDPEGKEFKDVVFGGALTNRPFMKNLVPINLSEASVEIAFDLVEAVTGKSLRGGENMPMEEADLNKIIEGVTTKLTETLNAKPPVPQNTVPNIADMPEIKELAESNPLVAALLQQVELTNATSATTAEKLKEAEIVRQLAEFDRSKIVLTPVAKALVYNLLKKMPYELTEDFWKLMQAMRSSQAVLVELGERAGANVLYGGDKSAKVRFNEKIKEAQAKGLEYPDAVTLVAAENPELYDEYRQESFSFKL